TASRTWMCILPYFVVVVIFALAKTVLPLGVTDIKVPWPGLTTVLADGTVQSLVLNYLGKNPGTVFNFNWLSNCGTLIVIAGVITALCYTIFNGKDQFKLGFGDAMLELPRSVYRMRYTILTITCVLSLAYVMNFSGQTISIGQFLAGTGIFFAFVSPLLGWVGTAVTGSDTSANALFSSLQAEAAHANPAYSDISSDLFLAANTMGGVTGKMISPQTLAIAAVATGQSESKLFKTMLPWSIGMLVALGIVVFLFATCLNFMIP
ncbi:MAG: L-lactate permease, partial [Anaerotardibacter sp.]